uniref:BHLH domain-containing protein n=1 Tax=Ascaris lumbricoides TaxID=6252 RepID=A0A0M3I9V6_ASCLU
MSSPSSPSSSSFSSSEAETLSLCRRRRFMKVSQERRERKETLAKLQRIVPTAREGISQLELLQRIIDYIADLQAQVDSFNKEQHENKENVKPSHMQTMSFSSRSSKSNFGGRTRKMDGLQQLPAR